MKELKEPSYNNEDLLDHHAVAAVIKDNEDKILIQEHTKYGFWTLPSGKVKEGQGIIEGLKQEIFEECNLIIKECKKVFAREHEYERRNKKLNVNEHIFEVTNYSGILENKEPLKHTQQKFFSIKEIINLPHVSNLIILYLKTLGIERTVKLE